MCLWVSFLSLSSYSRRGTPHRPPFSVLCPPSSRGLALRIAVSIFFMWLFARGVVFMRENVVEIETAPTKALKMQNTRVLD